MSSYKDICLELFNIPFNKYKTHKNKKIEIKSPYPDYELFCNILLGFEIISDLIKYSIWKNKEFFEKTIKEKKDLYEITVNLPKNQEELLILFKLYPWTIDELNTELYTIISLEHYELMYKLSKINKLLYFSIFEEDDQGQFILNCEDDVTELWVNIKLLVKKLLKCHIEIAKIK
jgi:hypothetical protein